MRVMLVGSGGREAALAWRIAQSPTLEHLLVTGANPGWPDGVEVRETTGVEAWVDRARSERIDLVVVGPEAPLAAGLGDALEAAGIPCFGPKKAAAELEASKSFAKEIMQAVGVPTAGALVVDRAEPDAEARVRARLAHGHAVLKADGLAAGKGVFVCPTEAEALEALDALWGTQRFGGASSRLVVEDLLEGPEVSLFALSDGERVVPLVSSQDHKRLGDGDRGPNTGGMGAYAPCALVAGEEADALVQQIHKPVVDELARRGTPYRGVLYAGLMMTPEGPRVLEFNVRFGDPECQPLMCLWDEDVLPWLYGAAVGELPAGVPHFAEGAACCVVLASAGYPATSTKGVPIPEPDPVEGVHVFFAGARRGARGLETAGGRVLGITGVGEALSSAVTAAYDQVARWQFDGAQFRTDIAAKAPPSAGG